VAIVSLGTPAVAHGTSGSVTGTWPNGTPGNGDFVLAAVSSGASTSTTPIVEGSGTWNLLCISCSSTQPCSQVAWFYKVAGASESAPSFTSTQSGTAGGMSAILFDFTGVNTSDPIDVMGFNANFSAGSVTGLSVVTSGNVASSGEYALFASCHERAAGTNTWTAPTNFTNVANDGATSTRSHLAVDYYSNPPNGSTLTASGWSWTTHSSAWYCAALIVLNPSGSASSTYVYAAPGAGASFSGDSGIALSVKVLTGGIEAGGNSLGTQGTAIAESPFTPTYSNSYLVYGAVNYTTDTAFTALSNTTLDFNYQNTVVQQQYAGGYFNGTTSAGVQISDIGVSAPSGDACAWCIYEVQPSGGSKPALDASTPTIQENPNTVCAVTPRFSPPSGSVLVATIVGDTTTAVSSVTVQDNNGLTWTKRALGQAAADGYAAIYTATYTGPAIVGPINPIPIPPGFMSPMAWQDRAGPYQSTIDIESLTLTDAGIGTDTLGISLGAAPVDVPLTDSGTGTDALGITGKVALGETGAGAVNLFVPAFAVAGAGTVTLTSTASISLSVTGAGTVSLFVPAFTVSGTGTAALGIKSSVPLAETGTGTVKLFVPAFAVTGAGSVVLTTTASIALSVTGAGAVSLFIPAFAVGGAGSDSLGIKSSVPLAIAGSGTTALFVPAFAVAGTGTVTLTTTASIALAVTGVGAVTLFVPAFAVSGAGTVTLGIASSVSFTGTGVGSDTLAVSILTIVPVALSVTGSGTTALFVPAFLVTGAGTVALSAPGFLVTGSGTVTLTCTLAGLAVSLPDTGAGTPALYVSPALTVSGAGTDALGTVAGVAVSDTGAGTATYWPGTRLTASGAGSDALLVARAAPLAEAGSGLDTLGVQISVAVPLTDAGHGLATLVITAFTVIGLPEAGSGTDALLVSPGLAVSGQGSDTLRITARLAVSETGHGLATLSLTQPTGLAEVGSGSDSLTVGLTVPLGEIGAGTDEIGFVFVGGGGGGWGPIPAEFKTTGQGDDTFSVPGFPGQVTITNRVANPVTIGQQAGQVSVQNVPAPGPRVFLTQLAGAVTISNRPADQVQVENWS